jgi:hypothetical protein
MPVGGITLYAQWKEDEYAIVDFGEFIWSGEYYWVVNAKECTLYQVQIVIE